MFKFLLELILHVSIIIIVIIIIIIFIIFFFLLSLFLLLLFITHVICKYLLETDYFEYLP